MAVYLCAESCAGCMDGACGQLGGGWVRLSFERQVYHYDLVLLVLSTHVAAHVLQDVKHLTTYGVVYMITVCRCE